MKPLGLERTTFRLADAVVYPFATGYNTITTDEPEIARPYAITRAMAPAGTILGTVGDLVKFAEFHLGDGKAADKRVLSPGALAEMQRIQASAANMAAHWGLGWWIQPEGAHQFIGHGGSTNGQRASLTIVPARRFACSMLTNGSNGAAVYRLVERHLLEQAGAPRVDPSAIELPDAAVQRFAGRYHSPGGDVTVAAQNGGLTVDMFARNAITGTEYQPPTRHAVAIASNEFLVTDTDVEGSRFDFVLHGDGSVRFLRMGGRLYDPVG